MAFTRKTLWLFIRNVKVIKTMYTVLFSFWMSKSILDFLIFSFPWKLSPLAFLGDKVAHLGPRQNQATALTLEGPSTSIDVFSFRNACKMASVKSYDTIFSELYFFINTCLLSKFQDFSASGYRKNYVTT